MNERPSRSPQPAAPAWRHLAVLLCLVTGVPSVAVPASAQESQTEGLVAYSLALQDFAGGYTAGGFGAAALDGTSQRRLTSSGRDILDRVPRWSPDGRWLAFTRQTGSVRQPRAVSASGTDVALAETGWHPSWSPDGRALVWAVDGGAPGIVVAQVTGADGSVALGERRLIPLPRRPDAPVVSPDGTALLFRMRREPGSQPSDLWTVGLDGSGLRQLSHDVDVSVGWADSHSWSPDGSQVVFLGADAASRGGRRAHLVSRDGTNQRLLFPTSGCEFTRAAVWAPHGEFLAVVQNCQEQGFHIVTPAGKHLGNVGAGPGALGRPAFSPDGADLYAAALPQGAESGMVEGQLHRIPLDGSPAAVVVESPGVAVSSVAVAALAPVEPRVVTPPPPPPGEDTDPDRDPRLVRPLLERACPIQEVPYADFLDVDIASPHRRAIDCMAWWDVVTGVAPLQYRPLDGISRAQTATLLARVITAGGGVLPVSARDRFDDDDDSPHAANVNRLAKAGIIRGAGRRLFRPGAAVRRDQMASLIMATYRYLDAATAPATTPRDYFTDDDDSVHQGAINAATGAGFVTGVSAGSYAPQRPEQRQQAASRAARVLDALVEAGKAVPPREGLAAVTKVVDGDTVLANDPQSGTVRVRFVGINATETGTCGALDARTALSDLVAGATVRMSSDDPSSIGRRQRPLRFVEVYREGRWVDVNAQQLADGHALWFPNDEGKEPRNSNRYQQAVRQAMAAGQNLWDPTKCGYGPQQGAQLKLWVRPDAPGSDYTNLNGEWVRIQNTGTDAVDLAGWSLRDASVRAPYRFTGDSVLPPGATMTVHVGAGTDQARVRYWGLTRPLFANPRRVDGQWVGDGAYLLDGDGDIRAHFMYPCIGGCPDPLLGRVEITYVSRGEAVDLDDEYVSVRNVSSTTVSLSGYRLVTAGDSYDFSESTQLNAGQTLVVRSGAGDDLPSVKYWGSAQPLLRGSNGTVSLRTFDEIGIACWEWGAGEC